jgi:hypothetical protein
LESQFFCVERFPLTYTTVTFPFFFRCNKR